LLKSLHIKGEEARVRKLAGEFREHIFRKREWREILSGKGG